MRIHADTLGTLLREVGRSPSGHDWVFVLGKKKGTSWAVLEASGDLLEKSWVDLEASWKRLEASQSRLLSP